MRAVVYDPEVNRHENKLPMEKMLHSLSDLGDGGLMPSRLEMILFFVYSKLIWLLAFVHRVCMLPIGWSAHFHSVVP